MFTIAGEVYEPIDRGSYTIAYDLYMQQVLDSSGITALLAASPDDDVMALILKQLIDADQVCQLLAGLLKPKDAAWSPAWARTAAAKFDKTTAPEDKRLLMSLLSGGLVHFFVDGPRYYGTSP